MFDACQWPRWLSRRSNFLFSARRAKTDPGAAPTARRTPWRNDGARAPPSPWGASWEPCEALNVALRGACARACDVRERQRLRNARRKQQNQN